MPMPGVPNRWTEAAIRLIPDRNSTFRLLGHRSRSSANVVSCDYAKGKKLNVLL